MIEMSVVLPQPLGPTSSVISRTVQVEPLRRLHRASPSRILVTLTRGDRGGGWGLRREFCRYHGRTPLLEHDRRLQHDAPDADEARQHHDDHHCHRDADEQPAASGRRPRMPSPAAVTTLYSTAPPTPRQ